MAFAVCSTERLPLVYKGPLADLQGRLVPQLRGIFGSCQSDGVQVWCVMLDDAGEEIKPSERRSNWVQKSVRKAYADLHAAGVLHGDVQWRHIRRLGMSKALQLVDFDRAQLRSACMSEEDWEDLTRIEMDCVEILLECTIPCSPAKQDSTLRRDKSMKRRKPVPSFEPLLHP